MIEIPHITQKLDDAAGHWKVWLNKVVISCPGCGVEGRIDHTVSEDGTVSPSLVCPFDCGFHEFVKLTDWVKLRSQE